MGKLEPNPMRTSMVELLWYNRHLFNMGADVRFHGQTSLLCDVFQTIVAHTCMYQPEGDPQEAGSPGVALPWV